MNNIGKVRFDPQLRPKKTKSIIYHCYYFHNICLVRKIDTKSSSKPTFEKPLAILENTITTRNTLTTQSRVVRVYFYPAWPRSVLGNRDWIINSTRIAPNPKLVKNHEVMKKVRVLRGLGVFKDQYVFSTPNNPKNQDYR